VQRHPESWTSWRRSQTPSCKPFALSSTVRRSKTCGTACCHWSLLAIGSSLRKPSAAFLHLPVRTSTQPAFRIWPRSPPRRVSMGLVRDTYQRQSYCPNITIVGLSPVKSTLRCNRDQRPNVVTRVHGDGLTSLSLTSLVRSPL